MHGAALAARITADPARQLGHHAFRIHLAGQHVAMVAVAGDDLVAFLQAGLHASHDRFLPDIEVAEAGNLAHAVELAGLLLETPDQQHLAVVFQHVGL